MGQQNATQKYMYVQDLTQTNKLKNEIKEIKKNKEIKKIIKNKQRSRQKAGILWGLVKLTGMFSDMREGGGG